MERGDAHALGARDPIASINSIPHRPPFRFLSTAQRIDGGAVGSWRIDGAEDFLAGHFPGRPIVPGVLVTEALAQLAATALAPAEQSDGDAPPSASPARRSAPAPAPMLATIEMRLRSVVVPPAEISLEARLDRVIGPLAEFEVRASCRGRAVAEGRLVLRSATGATS